MKELYIEIITPSKVAFKGNVKSINIPGVLGNFQVLFNHAPILSSFEIGVIKIVDTENNVTEFSTGGGTVEVLTNKILVLAESLEKKEEIDTARAEEALQRAKDRLSQKNKDNIDAGRAEAALKRAINRLKLSGKTV